MMISKWMIVLALVMALVMAVLILLYVLGKKSVHSEVMINASPEKVWQVLMNTDDYPNWNPVLIPKEGVLQEGTTVKYEFRQDENNISEIPSTVRKMIPNELLNQGGGIPGILSFDHRYMIKAEGSQTKVIIHEEYRGIGVNFWNPAPVEAAYHKLNTALKERVESL